MAQSGARRVLVLVTDYPGGVSGGAHRFVHVRNLYYVEHGIDVTVLNFKTKVDYEYEGIRVISLSTYKAGREEYSLLITHQANLRQHYRFLRRYGNRFAHFIFFFHGHEVLRLKKNYPKPYPYVNRSRLKVELRDGYDLFKLAVWRRYLPGVLDKSWLVFVSKWMLEEFLKATKIRLEVIQGRYDITYNGVGRPFQEGVYDPAREKKYDFITIRSNLDGSNYCIDLVNELAKHNPGFTFLVIGKGRFFDYNVKAPNLIWQDRTMNHQEILEALQQSRCALMPTRNDTQGLMSCEMATFGIPVITSNISVCHEIFEGFQNVYLLDHDAIDADLGEISARLARGLPYPKNEKYFGANTCAREVEIIRRFLAAPRQ